MLRIQTPCNDSTASCSTDFRTNTCGSVLYYTVVPLILVCRIDVAAFRRARQNLSSVAAFVLALDGMYLKIILW